MSSLKVSWLPPKYHHNQCWETTRTQYFSKRNSKWPSMRWIRNVDVLTYMHQSHWIHDIFALLGGNQKKQFFLKKPGFFPNYGKNPVFRFPPQKKAGISCTRYIYSIWQLYVVCSTWFGSFKHVRHLTIIKNIWFSCWFTISSEGLMEIWGSLDARKQLHV